jgi:hypothetical protein
MPNDVRVVLQRETMKADAAGRWRAVIETQFMVGDDGPFYVCQDEATFDPATQAAMVNNKADAVRASRAGSAS